LKKIALISSHCDTQEKIDVLNQNIKKLKSLNVDTMVISTLKIDVDSDFLFITKENPVLRYPERCIVAWKTILYNNQNLKLTSAVEDYGWASLYQIKKVMEIASTYNYDIFYFLIYDLEIDEKIETHISDNEVNFIYPRKDFKTDFIWPSSLHFAIFDKNKLKMMADLIDKNSYMKIHTGFAEDFVRQCVLAMGMDHSKHVVKDLIQAVNMERIFNSSLNKSYKLFFNKSDSNMKVLFYDNDKLLYLHLNNETYVIEKNIELIQSNVGCHDLINFKVTESENVDDYLPIYNSKTRNHIYFE